MVAAQTLEEIQSTVRDSSSIRIAGSGHHSLWSVHSTGRWSDLTIRSNPDQVQLDMSSLAGIVNWSAADQVIVVRAGTNIGLLQDELGSKGQCLPIVGWFDGYAPTNVRRGTIGGHLSMNLPQDLENVCGNWRDWVLGLKVVLANGEIVKCGSPAVKNVAGYDSQKLFVGARGSLGVVVEVTLRTFPVKLLPRNESRANYDRPIRAENWWVQRVKQTDFCALQHSTESYARTENEPTATIWCQLPPDQNLPRYPGDWVIRSGCGEKNVQITDPTQIRLMKRAKEIFDPTNKLNPGEWGFM